jgi:hypothetical protein
MKSSCCKRAGTYAVRLIGALSLISACHGQTFTLAADPTSLTIYPGQQGVPVTITASGTSTGPISVRLDGLPSGVAASPLTLAPGSSGTLTLSASLSAGQEGFSPSGPSMTTSWTTPVTVVGAAGSTQSAAQFSLIVSISNPSFAPAASAINLAIVNINTNGVAIVSKAVDVPGTISITSADGQTSYLPNSGDTDNTATFHVHGSSTALMPKLPYHISLTTGVDLLNTMGLQCPYVTDSKGNPTCDKSKSYILLANYDDKTLLRDWSASALANAIPIGNGYLDSPADSPTPSGTGVLMPWAPHSLFVELYLNGAYEGNYQLIEEVKVDTHRVDINKLSEADTAPTQITGGYLLEIDQHEDEAYVFFTPQNLPIGLIDPDFSPDPEVPQQTSYITNYVDTAETALFSSNFADPARGWRAYFDETSAINYYIVNEVMGNVDGGDFYSSVYLYKNEDNPLLYMGPIWDFDISSGNVNYETIVDPTVSWMQNNAIWYQQWFKDPGFQADVVTQWNTLMKNGVFTAWLASIQQEAESLEQTQVNNFGRWPMQGIEVWPNTEAAGSYSGEVRYLINWLTLHIAYLDSLFNSKALTLTTLGVSAGTLLSGSPVTLTAQVTGGTAATGIVSFLASGIVLGTGSLNGDGVASLTVSNLPAGSGSLQAVYNGDNANALSSSAPQAVTVADPPAGTVTNLAAPPATGDRSSAGFFTASVIRASGAALPTGTVTFSVDLGQGTAMALDATGKARYYARPLTAGAHTIVASYSGDTNHSASSSAPSVFYTSQPPCRSCPSPVR